MTVLEKYSSWKGGSGAVGVVFNQSKSLVVGDPETSSG